MKKIIYFLFLLITISFFTSCANNTELNSDLSITIPEGGGYTDSDLTFVILVQNQNTNQILTKTVNPSKTIIISLEPGIYTIKIEGIKDLDKSIYYTGFAKDIELLPNQTAYANIQLAPYKNNSTESNTTNNSSSQINSQLKPAIGKIYYDDGSCSYSYLPGRIPVGFICSLNENGTVDTIIALNDSEKGLELNFAGNQSASSSFTNGVENTKHLRTLTTKSPALQYCNEYSVNVAGFEAGKWYLPALNEMTNLYFYQKYFQDSLDSLIRSGYPKLVTTISDVYYWTSTFYVTTTTSDKDRMFYLAKPISNVRTYTLTTYAHYVRPMYKFIYD